MSTRRIRFGWAMFDWAQQPYFNLIGSFVFRPYFVGAVALSPQIGQAQIGYTAALAGLIVALAGPPLGIALEHGSLKAWLAVTSLPFVLACAGLWWVVPGGEGSVLVALVCLTVAAAMAEITTIVNNAMLPPIAAPRGLGRLSGAGVALGGAGGIVAAVLVVAFVLQPDQPILGLDRVAHETQRFVGPFAAVWYLVFLIPLFLTYPARTRVEKPTRPFAETLSLVRSLPGNRVMLRFLIGRMLVADAAAALQIFGGIIAATTFGWAPAQLVLFGIFVLAFVSVGALAAGRLDDLVNARASVLASCVILCLALIGYGSVTSDHIFFVVAVDPPVPDGAFLESISERVFVAITAALALATAPLVGSMRTWLVTLSPPGEEGRWLGLYAVAGRATAFAAPFMISIATLATGELRSSIPVILAFLGAGTAVFWLVPAGRGASGHIAARA